MKNLRLILVKVIGYPNFQLGSQRAVAIVGLHVGNYLVDVAFGFGFIISKGLKDRVFIHKL